MTPGLEILGVLGKLAERGVEGVGVGTLGALEKRHPLLLLVKLLGVGEEGYSKDGEEALMEAEEIPRSLTGLDFENDIRGVAAAEEGCREGVLIVRPEKGVSPLLPLHPTCGVAISGVGASMANSAFRSTSTAARTSSISA